MNTQTKIHPEIQEILQNTLFPDVKSISIQKLREAFDKRSETINKEKNRKICIREEKIVTTQGIRNTRWYHLEGYLSEKSPTLIFFHHGGFVFGNLDTQDTFCQKLAAKTLCRVIASDYPLAPENPYPAAPEACYTLVKKLAQRLGNSSSIFVSGSSAGGTLAAVTAIMSCDRNGPKLAGQILLCPMISTAMNTVSYKEYAVGCGLTAEACAWFFEKYETSPKDRKKPYFAPENTNCPDHLPPSLIVTAEFDILRDEGIAYAERLTEAGTPTEQLCAMGMTHAFYSYPLKDSHEIDRTMAAIADFIRIHQVNFSK